jgi:ATP-dependent RNA helicase DeaD
MASVPGFLAGPLGRIDPAQASTQVLVITSDAETAIGVAESVLKMTGPAGIEVFPVTTARRASRLMSGRPIRAAAGRPRDIRDLMKGSHLKLDGVKAVVLAWADEILAGSQEDIDALEAVMAETPKDAARIVVTSRSEGRVNAFAERYLRRAVREGAAEDDGSAPVPVQYVIVTPSSRGASLIRLLDDLDPPSAAVIVSDDPSQESVSGTLNLLGLRDGSPAVTVTRGAIAPSTNAAIFYDAPLSRSQLTDAQQAGAVSIVALIEARELDSLRRTAGGQVKPFTLGSAADTARERDAATRRELSQILDSGSASRELLSLEPMLDRYDGIEIAAAALKLLDRERVLRRAAQDDLRAQQDIPRPAPSADTFERRPSGGRPASGGDRRPKFGAPREGKPGFDRGAPRNFRESRGPRDASTSRDARPRRDSGTRSGPPRGEGRPPKRDRK